MPRKKNFSSECVHRRVHSSLRARELRAAPALFTGARPTPSPPLGARFRALSMNSAANFCIFTHLINAQFAVAVAEAVE